MLFVFRPLLWLLAALAVASCSRPARDRADAAPPATAPAASGAPSLKPSAPPVTGVGVVADVNGAAILLTELDQRAAGRLTRLRQEEYEIRKQVLDELIAERLFDAEAARRGISRDELLRREVDAKAKGMTPAEIENIYRQNQARFAGQSREDAIGRIRQVVSQRTRGERQAAFQQELRRAARVGIRLDAPRARVDLPRGAPAIGPDRAPVTIVEFTDYQCPFCHRAQGVVEQILRNYQGRVRFVHLDFPLEGHPGALPAARAARCAGEQGKFWEYHKDLMMQPGPLDEADLEGRAGKLKLAAAAFAVCLRSGRHDEAIRASFANGESLGVTGTPAYFVNGRLLSGARPYEDFAEVIEAELAAR